MTRAPAIVLGAAVFVVLVALGVFRVGQAAAATYVNACHDAPADATSSTDAAIEVRELNQAAAADCLAITERLAAIDARLEAMDDATPGTAAQRVALSAPDRERLDLAWYGMWAVVGLLLVLLVSQKWYGAWRFLRE